MKIDKYKIILIALLVIFISVMVWKCIIDPIVLSQNHRFTIATVKSISGCAEGSPMIEYEFKINGVLYNSLGGLPMDSSFSSIKAGMQCWLKYYTDSPGRVSKALWDCPIPEEILNAPIPDTGFVFIPCSN
jgi:hypothetical protein